VPNPALAQPAPCSPFAEIQARWRAPRAPLAGGLVAVVLWACFIFLCPQTPFPRSTPLGVRTDPRWLDLR